MHGSYYRSLPFKFGQPSRGGSWAVRRYLHHLQQRQQNRRQAATGGHVTSAAEQPLTSACTSVTEMTGVGVRRLWPFAASTQSTSIRRLSVGRSVFGEQQDDSAIQSDGPPSEVQRVANALSSITDIRLPNKAKVVICGGGLQGAAIAFKLVERGYGPQTVVIDRGMFGCGKTWNSSGVITLVNRSRVEAQLTQRSLNLYHQLEDMGYSIGARWDCGSMFVAQSVERLNYYKRLESECISQGITCNLTTSKDAIAELFPFARVEDLRGGLHVPGDSVACSRDICNALLTEALKGGVTLVPSCDVNEVMMRNNMVRAVCTNKGDILCDHFVNAAGNWARAIGTRSSTRVHVPCHPAEHYILHVKGVGDKSDDDKDAADAEPATSVISPVLRDHDAHVWIRKEGHDRFICGGLHSRAKPVDVQKMDQHSRVTAAVASASSPSDTADVKRMTDHALASSFTVDWDHFYLLLDGILKRVPSIASAEYDVLVNNPEPFTPDGQWLVGRSTNAPNYYVSAGFRSVGLSAAGGVADVISDLICDGHSSINTYQLDVQRFVALHNNRKFLTERIKEVPGRIYAIPYPFMEYKTGRCLRTGSIFTKIQDAGARFNQIMGYERPMYFNKRQTMDDLSAMLTSSLGTASGAISPNIGGNVAGAAGGGVSGMGGSGGSGNGSGSSSGDSAMVEGATASTLSLATSNSFGMPTWFNCVRDEFLAARTSVALCDYSAYAKMDIWSRDAAHVVGFLQMLCSQNIDIPVGAITHSGMQNESGGYENDCTVCRLAPDRFLLISPSFQQSRLWAWINRHLYDEDAVHNDGSPAALFRGKVFLEDTTSLFSTLALIGPHARAVLSRLTPPGHLDDFRFFTWRQMDVGCAPNILVMNLTHVGEHGYVLYIPNEFALHVYESLLDEAEQCDAVPKGGLKNCGYYAMRALRIEKFYAFVGQDLDAQSTPLECGRAFRVKLDTDINFIGRTALMQQSRQPQRKMLVMLLLDPTVHSTQRHPWPWGGETVFRDGQCVGHVTTASYAFSLQKHAALAFLHRPDGDGDDNGEGSHADGITADYIRSGKYEIEIAGVRYPASVRINAPRLPTAAELADMYASVLNKKTKAKKTAAIKKLKI